MTRHFTREMRESAVQRSQAGEDAAKIAAELGCHPSTVTGWVRKNNAPPGEAPAAGGGAKGAGAMLAQASAPPATPPPTAEELLATVEALRVTTLSAIAQAKDLDPAHAMVAAIIAIPKAEKDVLRTLAPQAAKYAPEVLERMPAIAALSFVIVYGFSGWSAIRKLGKLAEDAKAIIAARERAAKDTEPTRFAQGVG